MICVGVYWVVYVLVGHDVLYEALKVEEKGSVCFLRRV